MSQIVLWAAHIIGWASKVGRGSAIGKVGELYSMGATVYGIHDVIFATERIVVIDDDLTILSQMIRLKYPLLNLILVWAFWCNDILLRMRKKKNNQ